MNLDRTMFIRLPEEVHKAIKAKCEKEGSRSMSSYVRELIVKDYNENIKNNKSKSK
jgi:predicted DNA-binding protein